MKTVLLSIAATLAAFGVQAVASANDVTVRQEVVSYSDLDVTQFDGAQALYDRITQAAREVCGRVAPWPVDAGAVVRACRKDATARAVADVNEPALTNYYVARTGRQVVINTASAATLKTASR